MQTYDVAVVGGGPGGYACAFRAAQLGLRVALIEKRTTLGGTCLNEGCIPSKALLHSTEQLVFARDHAATHGLRIEGLGVDLQTMQTRKNAVVAKLTAGIASLAKARKVMVFNGSASFLGPGSLEVLGSAPPQIKTTLSAKNIVVATGSTPVELPFLPFDGNRVVTSEQALTFDKIPESLAVVGGGAIGLELGSVWARLGAKVTVIEFLPRIAASYDEDLTRNFTRILQKQGLQIETGAKVVGWNPEEGRGMLRAERDGRGLEIAAEKVLVAVGRRPYTTGLGLERLGLSLDEKGRLPVDTHLRTEASGVWAIGDVVAGPMLAHKAEEDGVAVAEWIAGRAGHVNWDLVPGIIYTDPELAMVGLGEAAAAAKGHAIRVGKFSFAANGRALASDATDGFVKVIAEANKDRILGAQILGRGAGELIAQIVSHMEYGGSAEDLGRTIHAHPTMSEALKEAALAVSKSSLHSI